MADKNSRGWNDPPPLPVNLTSSTSSKQPVMKLNKRVAFPMAGLNNALVNSEGNSSAANTPPKMLPAMPPTTSNNEMDKDSGEDIFDDVIVNPDECLNNLMQFMESAVNLEHKHDIEKRLGEMNKMWKEGCLDKQLCSTILMISKALVKGEHDSASTLQLELISKWPSESSKWAAAIRSLVNHLRLQNEPNLLIPLEAEISTDQNLADS